EQRFEARASPPEYGPGGGTLEEPLGRLLHEIESLLLHEPRDDADKRRARARIEAELLEERGLADALPIQRLAVVARCDGAIGSRVPLLHVDAVQDPRQVCVSRVQHALEPKAEFLRRLD